MVSHMDKQYLTRTWEKGLGERSLRIDRLPPRMASWGKHVST